MDRKAWRYTLARLSERTTYTGIALMAPIVAPLMGISVTGSQVESAIAVVSALAGFALTVLPSPGSSLGSNPVPAPVQPSPPGATAADLNRQELQRIGSA